MIKIPEKIELLFYTRKNLKDPADIMKIIHKFLSLGEDFYPEEFSVSDFYEGVKFKEERDLKRIENVLPSEDVIQIYLAKYKPHYAELEIERKLWEGPSRAGYYSPSSLVNLILEEDHFKEDKERLSNIFIEWGKYLYDIITPYYGYGEQGDHHYETSKHIPAEKVQRVIPMIYWLNFLGPDFVNLIGREKILKAPFWKIEEFKDGGLLLISAPTPFESLSEEGFKKRKEIYKSLGLEGIEIDIGELERKFFSH